MLILADTNIWIYHFRQGLDPLVEMLENEFLACHRTVIGELATGRLPARRQTLSDLQLLPSVPPASFDETLHFIEERQLYGRGLQWNDLLLLASVVAEGNFLLWTRDRRLREAAEDMEVSYAE